MGVGGFRRTQMLPPVLSPGLRLHSAAWPLLTPSDLSLLRAFQGHGVGLGTWARPSYKGTWIPPLHWQALRGPHCPGYSPDLAHSPLPLCVLMPSARAP